MALLREGRTSNQQWLESHQSINLSLFLEQTVCLTGAQTFIAAVVQFQMQDSVGMY